MAINVLDSLNTALHNMLAEDPRVVVLGEDLLDPYGGAFKVTKGLSTKFPERVLTTPLSEAGFTALAAGMAMRRSATGGGNYVWRIFPARRRPDC